jgi:hypothetical protein
VGDAQVISAAGGVITLSQAVTVQSGDILFLGEVAAWPPVDGGVSIALAWVSGYSFARTLVDPLGRRGVPHFRAILSRRRRRPSHCLDYGTGEPPGIFPPRPRLPGWSVGISAEKRSPGAAYLGGAL